MPQRAGYRQKEKPGRSRADMAESEGFEPPIPLRVLLISNQVPSAARPALHLIGGPATPAPRTPAGLRRGPRDPAPARFVFGTPLCIRAQRTSRCIGGEGGIRTHDTLPYTRFPSVRLRPLGHLSISSGGRLRLPPAPPRAYAGDPRDPSPARFYFLR